MARPPWTTRTAQSWPPDSAFGEHAPRHCSRRRGAQSVARSVKAIVNRHRKQGVAPARQGTSWTSHTIGCLRPGATDAACPAQSVTGVAPSRRSRRRRVRRPSTQESADAPPERSDHGVTVTLVAEALRCCPVVSTTAFRSSAQGVAESTGVQWRGRGDGHRDRPRAGRPAARPGTARVPTSSVSPAFFTPSSER